MKATVASRWRELPAHRTTSSPSRRPRRAGGRSTSCCPTSRCGSPPTAACSPPTASIPAPSACCSTDRRRRTARRDLLDLGCGYGPIALTLAKRAPDATVWAVDVNRRALALCAENADGQRRQQRARRRAGRGAGRRALRRDPVQPADPHRQAGAARPARALAGRLAPDGRALLVVQQHLGADSLARWLDEQGWPTRRVSSRAGYRLLEVTRP